MKLDRIIKLERQFAEWTHNTYANAARFHWTAEFLNECLGKIWTDPTYRALPRYSRSFVDGVRYHCDQLHWKLVVFSYEIRGRRLTIDSKAFRRVSAFYVHSKCSESGAYVYRDNPAKLFTSPGTKLGDHSGN